MFKKSTTFLLIMLFLFHPWIAFASGDPSSLSESEQIALYKAGYCAGERIPSSGYETTLQGMAARQLYSYGIVTGMSKGELDDTLFNLNGQLTWPMALVLVSRLSPDFDEAKIPEHFPTGIPPWAASAYGYLSEKGLFPAGVSLYDPVSMEQFQSFCMSYFHYVTGGVSEPLQHPSIRSSEFTRGDAFLVLCELLKTIKRVNPSLFENMVTASIQFTLPRVIHLTVTDVENGLAQLDEAFKIAPESVRITGPEGTVDKFLVWTGLHHASTNLEYEKQLLFSKYFARYSMHLLSSVDRQTGDVMINCAHSSYEIATYLRVDSEDWLECYVDPSLSSLY